MDTDALNQLKRRAWAYRGHPLSDATLALVAEIEQLRRALGMARFVVKEHVPGLDRELTLETIDKALGASE